MKTIFMTFILTLTLSGFAFGECSLAEKKALEAFDHAWSVAGEKGDRAALNDILADEYVGLPAMITKAQNIEDAMRTFEQNKANPQNADQFSSDNYLISCTPTTATITHRNKVTTKNGTGGKEETFYSRSVHFLEKRGGKWQAVSSANHGLDDYGVLMYMEHDWNNAYVKRDASWFEQNYAADYSNVSSGTAKLTTKAADIAEFKADKSVTTSAELSELNIRVDGNTAIITGVNHVKGRDEKGQPMDYRLRFTDTFIKRDGRWQVWATQGTRIQ